MLEPIKQGFQLSDTELGLLAGPAFALFYATMGLPRAPSMRESVAFLKGHRADCWVVLASGFSALAGYGIATFVPLFLMRSQGMDTYVANFDGGRRRPEHSKRGSPSGSAGLYRNNRLAGKRPVSRDGARPPMEGWHDVANSRMIQAPHLPR